MLPPDQKDANVNPGPFKSVGALLTGPQQMGSLQAVGMGD